MAEQPDPSRTSKRDDTWEPVRGRVGGRIEPFDLTGADLRFLAFAHPTEDENDDIVIDSNSVSPDHGICINVEDIDGPGDEISIEWPPGSGEIITVPENRGIFQYEPTETAVSVAEYYRFELEATKDGKKLTFPNDDEENPAWRIAPDIA